MKILLYADDIGLISRWKFFLDKKYHIEIVSTKEEIYLAKNSFFILLASIKVDNKKIMLKKVQENQNLVLILDENPNLIKAKGWLSQKVNGYGNAYMKEVFFNSAVETIISGYSWLSPKIAHEFFLNLSNNRDNSEEKNDILSTLTTSEIGIANYLKMGYKNIEISKELDISINTVKKHIKNIYIKLNVSDRVSFAKLFL